MVETEWTHPPLAWSLFLSHLQQPPKTKKNLQIYSWQQSLHFAKFKGVDW